jgi:hypothetical protein
MNKLIIVLLTICMSSVALAGKPPKEPRPDLEQQIADLQALVATLQAQQDINTTGISSNASGISVNATAITAVGPHSPDFSNLLADVTRGIDPDTGYDTLLFSEMNVQIVNGTGITGKNSPTGPSELPNGTGNLIIGYNELRNNGSDNRSGSHMLILGDKNNYLTYGGVLAGRYNQTSGAYASVNGGNGNVASGIYSSAVGEGNRAAGNWSSVSGGAYNSASGHNSSVSGGYANTASGEESSVSGGYFNNASGWRSSVSGGYDNTASGSYSTVSGGYQRQTGDSSPANDFDWVAGSLFEDE